MTWAEYLIRVDGYLRQERKEAREQRTLLYQITKAPHLDPKTIPRTEQQFMSIPGDELSKPRLSDKARELWNKRMEEYNQKKKQ